MGAWQRIPNPPAALPRAAGRLPERSGRLAELSGITTKLKSMALIAYIDSGDNKEYSVYRKEQDLLSLQARRLQEAVARYQSEKKRKKTECPKYRE